MNLALHGFLLQVFVSILDFQHGSLLCSAGEPGYLDFDNLPETNFSCQGKVIGGYYADVEAGCQMFHVCTIGQKDEIMDIKFLCLNGTVFDQETRVCERVDEVDCSKSERFYNLNLELYGNNAVTLSLHENNEDQDDPLDSIDDHHQRTTSARPVTTTSTTTTTSKPGKLSTTPASGPFSHPTGYPQHYQPQPPFPQVHTSQSKSLYDDKNGGYHHQYIFHNGERNNNQATSYQLFSNQGVSSTTVQAPQGHQIRFSSTSNPQIIRNEPSTVAPLFHATSSTIQTLLNSNANSPSLINPIFHNHGIASTTEQFSIHSNNPRDTSEYRDNGVQTRPLEAVQATNKGKVSKLTISPVPTHSESSRTVHTKSSQSSESHRISGSFLPTPATIETTIRSFYPTPRSSTKSTQSSQSSSDQVTHHIHVLPPVPIPQLKPQQITINLPPPDIQRIVQNPSPLLPSQSRVIVTAKASVSDESGRPLNTTQLVTLPLPTIPASYDDYKEGDESFDPFYRDVPKIRNARRDVKRVSGGAKSIRSRRSLDQTRDSIGPFVYGVDAEEDSKVLDLNDKHQSKEKIADQLKDFKLIKDSLVKFRELLFNKELTDEGARDVFENNGGETERGEKSEKKMFGKSSRKVSRGESSGDTSDKTDEDQRYLEDLETKASKHLKADNYDSEREEESEDEEEFKVESEESAEDDTGTLRINTKESDIEEYVDNKEDGKSDSVDYEIPTNKETDDDEEMQMPETIDEPTGNDESAESDSSDETNNDTILSEPERTETDDAKDAEDDQLIDVVILNPEEYVKLKSSDKENIENSTEGDTNVPTIIPVLSTSEQPVEAVSQDAEKTAVPADITADAKVAKDSKKTDTDDESNKHHGRVESDESETSSVATEKGESKERKPGTKRKSSRIRLPKGRISARRKQGKDEEAVGVLRNEETTVGYKTSTTESPVVNFEAEQINSHIFEEPESQTSKEVDTRAVGERNKYPKDLQDSKGQETGKDNRKSEANDYETLEKHPNNLEKHQDKPNEFVETSERKSPPDESAVSKLDDQDKESTGEKYGELDSVGGAEHSANVANERNVAPEEKEYYKEETSLEEHESVEDESESISTVSNEESKDGSHESSEKKSFRETKSSRRGKSMKFEDSREMLTHREDKSMKFDNTEVQLESHEYSTIRTKEEINSEEVSSEYHDSTEASFEDTREISAEADYREFGSLEDTTISDEHVDYEENVDSQEEPVEEITENEDLSLIDHEGSTEGILKFTDELPKNKKEEVSEKKPVESLENVAHDYVDDNYEPHNYKEHDPTDSNNLIDEKTKKDATDDDTEDKTEYVDKEDVEVTTEFPKEESEGTKDDAPESEPEKPDDPKEEEKPVIAETTTSSTTMRPTTTTVRPTPPKLFKPISARKTYTYVPPTTTPNPVIIKPRFGLLNPKPAKPPKSYNELAPKPVIRKFPLLSRKTTTTVGTTTTEDREDFENVTDVPSTATETSRSEENVLEGKLETKGHAENSEVTIKKAEESIRNKDDQLSSPSEQKTPVNFRQEVGDEESRKDSENFTPYPVARFSTLASTIEKTLKEIESTSTEAEKSTTSKPFTFVDVDVVSTTVPSVPIEPSKSERNETTNEPTMDDEASTASSTKSEHNDATEVALVSEIPTSMMDPAIPTSDPDTLEGMKTTTVRFFNRKSPNSRRPGSFNCLEKEMYRFYGDNRDCRLFHYCSPGFTSRQVLDFRFVCEEGTAFDEESQSCLHDVRNSKCPNRW